MVILVRERDVWIIDIRPSVWCRFVTFNYCPTLLGVSEPRFYIPTHVVCHICRVRCQNFLVERSDVDVVDIGNDLQAFVDSIPRYHFVGPRAEKVNRAAQCKFLVEGVLDSVRSCSYQA